MRIIITGGTGLIGAALTRELAEFGHEVIVLSRSPQSSIQRPSGVRVVGWDARSPEGWGHLADGAGAIVNLAGESIAGENLLSMRWTAERKRGILQSRINAGQAINQAVQAASVKPAVVVQSSAVGYYGARGDEKLTEESSAGDDFLANVCKQWEAATFTVEGLGVRRVVIRSAIVLSAQGGTLPLQMLPYKFFVGGKIGSGKQGFSWIHIADEVAAIRFLIESPSASGVFNLAAPDTLTNAAFGKELGRVMSRPSFFPTPGFVFKLAFGEAATVLLEGQMAVPARLTALGYQFKFPTAAEALKDLLSRPQTV